MKPQDELGYGQHAKKKPGTESYEKERRLSSLHT